MSYCRIFLSWFKRVHESKYLLKFDKEHSSSLITHTQFAKFGSKKSQLGTSTNISNSKRQWLLFQFSWVLLDSVYIWSVYLLHTYHWNIRKIYIKGNSNSLNSYELISKPGDHSNIYVNCVTGIAAYNHWVEIHAPSVIPVYLNAKSQKKRWCICE